MSRWRSDAFTLQIGPHECVLGGDVLASRAGDWSALGAELAANLPPRARLSVTLADCWARYFLLAPPEGVTSLRDCRLLLVARFESLYGHAPTDWVLQADWQAGAPMLACALPRACLDALAPFRLASVQPQLLALWNRHCVRLPDSGALCAYANDQANLLYWSGARMRLVRQQKGADADVLLALELARLDASLPQARYWCGAAVPVGWTVLEAFA